MARAQDVPTRPAPITPTVVITQDRSRLTALRILLIDAARPTLALLGDLPAVNDHGEEVCDDQDAGAPGKGYPDVGADRLGREQVADRVDDGGHRLIFGEGTHRAR